MFKNKRDILILQQLPSQDKQREEIEGVLQLRPRIQGKENPYRKQDSITHLSNTIPRQCAK